MQINATITGIKYQVFLTSDLEKISLENFDINTCPTSCIIEDKKGNFAISKWVSPKRTRSYPYERVLNSVKKFKQTYINLYIFCDFRLKCIDLKEIKMLKT